MSDVATRVAGAPLAGMAGAFPAREGVADGVAPRSDGGKPGGASHAPASSLAARCVEHTGALPARITFAAARALCGAVLATGALWGLSALSGVAVPVVVLFLLAFLGAMAVSACSLNARLAIVAPIGVLVLAIAAFAFSPLADGMRALWNCFASELADASSWRLPELALSGDIAQADAAVGFCLMASPFAGALLASLAGVRRCWWVVLLVPFPLFCVFCGGMTLPVGPLVCMIAGVAGALGLASARGVGVLSRAGDGVTRVLCSVLLAALALAGTGLCAAIVSPSKWQQPEPLQTLRDQGDALLHELRYGIAANGLTNGDFSKAANWWASQDVALQLEGDGIAPMYLRGYVGSLHDGKGWHELTQADYHASDALFWWLNDDGFSPLTQLSSALAASMDNGEAARQLQANGKGLLEADVTVHVRNVGASSEWAYVPYGLTRQVGSLEFQNRADESLAPRSLFGVRDYSFDCRAVLETSGADVAALSWIARDEGAAYWRDESNYNAFVYKQYAQNSDADETVVTTVLGEAASTEGAHVDYASAANAIVAWLAENTEYDETAPATDDGAGLLADFLMGSKRGWSAHYATAAVAMLRHYGIPARYVEGYVVTPADVDAAKDDVVQVPAANGHAWAEMYVDGAGWVPVETVPSMRSVMPQPDWAAGIEAGGTTRALVPPTSEQALPPDQDTALQALSQMLAGVGRALVVALVLFDVFALVFFLVSVVLRFIARSRRLKAFSDPDDTAATRSMSSWMAEVARYRFPGIAAGDARALETAVEGAYGVQAAADWGAAQAIGRKAAFSTHGVTPEERAAVAGASDRFAQTVAKAEGAHGRWTMKYIERLM